MKTLLMLPLLWLLMHTAHAQDPALGLEFNEQRFGEIPELPDPNQGTKAIGIVPTTADLSRYAPPVVNQGQIQSCVAWSTAYNGYAIQYAAHNKITDPGRIQAIALSAMLPYKQLRPSCDQGLDLSDIVTHIRQNGNVNFTDFSSASCSPVPSTELLSRARQNRPIKDFARLFDNRNSNAEKIYKTKQQIGLFNSPVIAGIMVTDKLMRFSDGEDFYQPGGKFMGLHAVTVVGYDLVSFKILNTWGPNWGRSGYFSIRFDDFARIAVAGIALVLPDGYTPPTPSPRPTPDHRPNPSPSNTIRVSGEFAFQYLDPNGAFLQIAPYHLGNGVYELSRKDWQLGQMFQMVANSTRGAQYMCVFSIDAAQKVEVHWPLNAQLAAFNEGMYGLNTSDIIPRANFDQVIPAKDKALTITQTGTDYLCVIYSDKPLLNQLPAILGRIQNTPGNINTRLRAGLGSRLILPSIIRYQSNQMSGSATATQGDVIPIVLKIQSN